MKKLLSLLLLATVTCQTECTTKTYLYFTQYAQNEATTHTWLEESKPATKEVSAEDPTLGKMKKKEQVEIVYRSQQVPNRNILKNITHIDFTGNSHIEDLSILQKTPKVTHIALEGVKAEQGTDGELKDYQDARKNAKTKWGCMSESLQESRAAAAHRKLDNHHAKQSRINPDHFKGLRHLKHIYVSPHRVKATRRALKETVPSKCIKPSPVSWSKSTIKSFVTWGMMSQSTKKDLFKRATK